VAARLIYVMMILAMIAIWWVGFFTVFGWFWAWVWGI
jgi:hypothetical protein